MRPRILQVARRLHSYCSVVESVDCPGIVSGCFTPTETLSMFLAQAMNADRSCQNAVV